MGKSYSINGYINAALRRSARTFLVEGVTDKSAMHRLAVEVNPSLNGNVVIDHAGMIDEPETFGLGNKSKVIAVKQRAQTLANDLPKINRVLATLVDREWDGVNFEGRPDSSAWNEPAQEDSHYVTLGHSIENYFFEADCVVSFLKTYHAEHVTQQLFDLIEERFSGFLALAVCVSLGVREAGCLKKFGGFFNPSTIEFRNNKYYLTSNFAVEAAVRKVDESQALRQRINSLIDACWNESVEHKNTKWLLHGHVGSEVMWACVAHVAAPFFPGGTAEEIVRSHKTERLRFSQDWLSKAHDTNRFPLDRALTWLGAVV